MSNAQYFVYTRNRDNDYKLVYAPDDNFCPPDIRRYFLKQSRGVINIESFSGSLEEPRWLISRKGKYILFGVGVMNKILGAENNTDYTGTPIRGFFGMIIYDDNGLVKVPYDINFYKDLYKAIIDPIWGCSREDFKYKGVVVEQDVDNYGYLTASTSGIELNTSDKKAVILPIGTSVPDIIGSILSTPVDCSFVSGLTDKEHAFAEDYCYLNSTVIGVYERLEKRRGDRNYNVNARQIEITDTDHHRVKPAQPKKVLRPKLIILGVVVVTLIILLCKARQENQTNQDQSISGDTIQMDSIALQKSKKK